jgi:putative DNA primase/helicase
MKIMVLIRRMFRRRLRRGPDRDGYYYATSEPLRIEWASRIVPASPVDPAELRRRGLAMIRVDPLPAADDGYVMMHDSSPGLQVLEAALKFAEKGWPIFPVKPRGKTPLTAHGLKDATTENETILGWWQKWPSANIGVPTGEVVVVDIDGATGEASLRALEAEFGPLPVTLQSTTGKGRHFWFDANGNKIRNSAGKLGEGIDIRAKGGYVIAPPSIHESGKKYEWVSGDAPLAELPVWIAAKLKESPVHSGTNGHAQKISKGQRNTTLASLAGAMRRKGASEASILAALSQHNQQCCDPPLPDREVQTIAASVGRYEAAEEHPVTVDGVVAPQFSEEALALTFSARFADLLRYCAGWGRWLRWIATHWRHDDTLKVFDLARQICREAAAEIADTQPAMAKKLARAATVAAVEKLARADRRHAATIEQWDCDIWLLNTPAGTVDLRTGEQREHRRDDSITKCTAAGLADESDCPLWREFLKRVTGADVELEKFLQRVVGYCLTGDISEHALFFAFGTGANGKTVFISTLTDLLSGYAKTAPITTFIASSQEQHPTDVAGLCGARLVTAIETEEGRRWAEAKVKALTGGDKITARFMRQDFFEFSPQFKLLIAGNHKPSLRSVDEAIRRRLYLIPFSVTIPPKERDAKLGEKLRAEWPAILRWAVEGCLNWQKQGLAPPASVLNATAEYLAEEDLIVLWLEDRCTQGRQYSTPSGELYRNWALWCESAGEKPGSQKLFAQNLEARGFKRGHNRAGSYFDGLALKATP